MTANNKRTGVLVINPGNTSTKVAIFDREEMLMRENVEIQFDEIKKFPRVIDQYEFRRDMLEKILEPVLKDIELLAIAGRGGPVKPLEGGAYAVNQTLMDDLKSCKYSDHASNHGALLADYFAKKYEVKAYVVDPVTVDNFIPLARVSGLPEIERKCRSHALNIKAVGRVAAERLGKELEETNFVMMHLGSGFSICPLQGGMIIDVNDGMHGMGPFSINRAGGLPIGPLAKLCYSGECTEEQMLKKLAAEAGLVAYLGITDFKEALKRIENGDEEAKLVVDAMLYQCAKEAGGCAAALKGKVDAVVLTGGLAYADYVVDTLKDYLGFIAQFMPIPGEFEMEALARGVYRVLDSKEKAKVYK